jgi:hypothetical protein
MEGEGSEFEDILQGEIEETGVKTEQTERKHNFDVAMHSPKRKKLSLVLMMPYLKSKVGTFFLVFNARKYASQKVV